MLIKFVRVPDIRLEISTCRVYDSDSRCRTMEEEEEEGEKRKNSMKIEGGREGEEDCGEKRIDPCA